MTTGLTIRMDAGGDAAPLPGQDGRAICRLRAIPRAVRQSYNRGNQVGCCVGLPHRDKSCCAPLMMPLFPCLTARISRALLLTLILVAPCFAAPGAGDSCGRAGGGRWRRASCGGVDGTARHN